MQQLQDKCTIWSVQPKTKHKVTPNQCCKYPFWLIAAEDSGCFGENGPAESRADMNHPTQKLQKNQWGASLSCVSTWSLWLWNQMKWSVEKRRMSVSHHIIWNWQLMYTGLYTGHLCLWVSSHCTIDWAVILILQKLPQTENHIITLEMIRYALWFVFGMKAIISPRYRAPG